MRVLRPIAFRLPSSIQTQIYDGFPNLVDTRILTRRRAVSTPAIFAATVPR